MDPADLPPLWLLDVDGVLNAVSREPDWGAWSDWRTGSATAEGVSYRILFAPEAVAAVRDAHAAGRAEVRWLTTWGAAANDGLHRLLALPALAVAGERPDPALARSRTNGDEPAGAVVDTHARESGAAGAAGAGRWWKFDVVRRLVLAEPGRRIVWTDDDLADQPWALSWVADHADALLVSPDPRVGLVAPQVQAIEEFLVRPARR